MPSFNLIDQPWIPCTMRSGHTRDLSLKDALLRASDVLEVSDPSPLVTVALHRLLLAILHRNFGPRDAAAWAEMWDRGAWDSARLEAYLDRWHDRFDLFDERRPFYQVASLDFSYEGPISKLAHELSSGNNPTLFDHTLDQMQQGLSPGQAARYLIAYLSFAVGGLITYEKGQDPRLYKSADGAPLVKGAVALAKGNSLFQTLMLNLHRYDPSDEEPFQCEPDDCPAWERDQETGPEDRWPRGYLDLLTWQSRRVRLHPEDDDGSIVVRRAVAMKGFQFPGGFWRYGKETMIAFHAKEKAKEGEDPWPAVSFREERAIWRDSLALFQSIEGKWARPRLLDWLNDLAQEGVIDRRLTLPIDFLGLCTDQARVLLWRHERLPFPLAYLDDQSLLEALRMALSLAEETGRALSSAAWTMAKLLAAPNSSAPGARQPKAEVVRSLADGLGLTRPYWAALEVPFRKFMVEVVQDRLISADGVVTYGTNRLPGWRETLRRTAIDAFAEVASGLDGSPRSLRAVATAENQLIYDLSKTLQTHENNLRR